MFSECIGRLTGGRYCPIARHDRSAQSPFRHYLCVSFGNTLQCSTCFIEHWNAIPEHFARRLASVSKNTTFHPTLRHHPPEMEAMSLLMLDWPRLFFKPGSKCLPADTEHAGNTSHAQSFMIRTDYFFLFFFAPARAKIFAPILLPTLSIMSVFYDVHAVTAAASVSDNFLYHYYILTNHLLFYHYL